MLKYKENVLLLVVKKGLVQNMKDAPKVAVTEKDNTATLRFYGSEQVLAVSTQDGILISYMDDGMNMFYDPSVSAQMQWQLREAGEDCYYILINGQALTYVAESETVVLAAYEQSDAQKWNFLAR